MKKIYPILLIIATVIIVFSIAMMLAGCSVTKNKKSTEKEATHIVANDSARVQKNENSEKNKSDWERQIVIYNTPDTTINNYYPQPKTIIYERGSNSQEKSSFNYDSAFSAKLDSLKISQKEVVKEKKEQALSFWQIVGLCALVSVVLILISKLKISKFLS